jgi:hypothetical protein
MTAESSAALRPFGRYFAPGWQRAGRILSTALPGIPLIFVLCYANLSAWLTGPLIALIALGVVSAIAECFIAMTTIDEHGIRRRRPNVTRKICWEDVIDAKFTSSWGVSYVLLLLRNSQQVRLYGVTEPAVEGIRRVAAQTLLTTRI